MRSVIESRNQTFTMVDSSVYFDTLKNIFNGIQNITENTLPFWDYLGEGKNQVGCPKYLNGKNAKYDFRSLLDKKHLVSEDEDERQAFCHEVDAAAASVNVLDLESWPSAERLGLDESQLVVLQSTLTKELSIIQGPPGTGKSFIGLIVLKTFLHNKNIWADNDESTPLLLVCDTEHALDQLLTGIRGTFEGYLVRVASKSKCEGLNKFNLTGVGHGARQNRMSAPDVHREKQETRNKMDHLMADIQKDMAKLEILETAIVTESFLKKFIHKDLYKSLKGKNTAGRVFEVWLEITRDLEKIEHSDEHSEEHKEMQEEKLQEHFKDKFMLANGRKHAHKKTGKVDEETKRFNLKNTSFNISEYGESEMPLHLTDHQRQRWNSLIAVKQNYKRSILSFLNKPDRTTEQEFIRSNGTDVWKSKVTRDEKWKLYRHWVELYSAEIKTELCEKCVEFEHLTRRCQTRNFEEEKQTLKKATLVAMTTTEAAKYQSILQEIGPRIILVEGAASIPESHVIALLGEQCQHLIMIGDHKQPRLSSASPQGKAREQKEISLFERLVINGFEFTRLRYQHRMRPEISQLLRVPELYPELEDHDVVLHYPRVKNVRGNIRFIRHREKEDKERETKSFCNPFEARFIIGLLDYLLQQDYAAKQITILTPYAAQSNLIKKLLMSQKTSKPIEGLEISSVDNYQGKENDIILLSLVRSNNSKDIGFLKENNRMSVALSRARIGLYAIGNFYTLSRSSHLISNIEQTVKLIGHVSDTIKLFCTRHRNETIVSRPEDFKNVPEGGCQKLCSYRQSNGLSCKRICHADDPEHNLVVPFQ